MGDRVAHPAKEVRIDAVGSEQAAIQHIYQSFGTRTGTLPAPVIPRPSFDASDSQPSGRRLPIGTPQLRVPFGGKDVAVRDCKVNGCALLSLPVKGDERGSLVAIEAGRDVPFDIARRYRLMLVEDATGWPSYD